MEIKQSWKLNNKEHIKNYTRAYEARQYIKLRKRVSRAISKSLQCNGCSKGGSILNSLPYSISELKIHLESQFEPWMSWNNWGNYDPSTWNDNDPATWTWQIDHINAIAGFDYKTMADIEFLKAWALENLRPLSAKQNIIDGAARRRIHKAA